MKKKTIAKKITVKKKTTKKSKNLFVNFVLDETGSMQSCLDATISGFNEYIGTLKRKKVGDIKFTLNKFDSAGIRTLCKGVDVEKVPELTKRNYVPGACTPLYDTIAKTIKTTEKKLKSFKKKYDVLCVIMTDGEENASIEYDLDATMTLIKKKEKSGWIFVYLGANQNAWAIGKTLGMKKGNVVKYNTARTVETFSALAMSNVNYANSSVSSNKYGSIFSSKNRKDIEDDSNTNSSGKK